MLGLDKPKHALPASRLAAVLLYTAAIRAADEGAAIMDRFRQPAIAAAPVGYLKLLPDTG